MEYLPGGDMCDFVKCVELQESFYTACIVLGLGALHKMGIIHRDLKLENLMLDQGGYLKIIDYGLSKDRFGYTDRTNGMCGTRTYMAPEMLMDIGYGMAADWWALGISKYAMLMYELPFNNEDQNELVNSILYDEIKLPEELSEDVSILIYELLEKDPDYRLGSGEAGAEDTDWEQLLHRKTKPPYVFNNQGNLESFNNPECQAPALTTPAVKIPSELQEAFREFDYTPD
ncbi:hypothetical protein XELAEV_18012408mg [Xenopus laevis]|uniref:Protein kinase domain-containing protein n=1 Tax=Xenopus laevis TaxID=8355 RepID=A0A974DML8_XENLA|nr:hypothetical protein XELAEV_18012408mg [Xenopus laevis]